MATHSDPADTGLLLDAAAQLLQPAGHRPDPHEYGYPYEDFDHACTLALGGANLWLGIVEWMRGQDPERILRNSVERYYTASGQQSPSAKIYSTPAVGSVGGRDLNETRAARALSELVSGTVRRGHPREDKTVSEDVTTATALFERQGQHERARVLRDVIEAGPSSYVSDVCGFLRGQPAGIAPILATRDAETIRTRYRQQKAPPDGQVKIRCPQCRTIHRNTAGVTLTCDCGARLRVPARATAPPLRTIRCPGCRTTHQAAAHQVLACACGTRLRAPAGD
jgi:hypothetical protein